MDRWTDQLVTKRIQST